MDKIKVLLIDNDTSFGNIVTSFLSKRGFEVFYLNSLIAVSTIIRKWHPNIILLDAEIGNVDGIAAIPEIQIVSHKTPIIILSSQTESESINRALRMGAINYLFKPINMNTLPAYIERYAQANKSIISSIGDCILNLDTREWSTKSGFVKVLTHKEFNLLKLLILHKNTVVTMRQIKELWENASTIDEHTIYNYIRKVRALLLIDSTLALDKAPGGYMLSHTNSG